MLLSIKKRKKLLPESVSSYSRLVGTLKKLLLAVSVVLILLLLMWTVINPVDQQLKITFSPGIEEDIESQMVNPRFQGIDQYNQPYTITADIAIQETEEKVRLRNITADILRKDGVWISMTSQTGILMVNDKHITLQGQVNIIADNGLELRTETMELDLAKSLISSNSEVTIQSFPGTLLAKGFVMDNGNEKIDFLGPVRTVIYPESIK